MQDPPLYASCFLTLALQRRTTRVAKTNILICRRIHGSGPEARAGPIASAAALRGSCPGLFCQRLRLGDQWLQYLSTPENHAVSASAPYFGQNQISLLVTRDVCVGMLDASVWNALASISPLLLLFLGQFYSRDEIVTPVL